MGNLSVGHSLAHSADVLVIFLVVNCLNFWSIESKYHVPGIFSAATLLLIITVVAWILWPKKVEQSLKHKLRLLFFLPGTWVVDILWSSLFPTPTHCGVPYSLYHYHISHNYVPANPDWVSYPIYGIAILAALFSIYCIWYMKGARWFTFLIILANGYYLWMLSVACFLSLDGGLCGL
jgi:hypothetical protein